MYEGASIGVVVPAYNEAGFIGDVLETIPGYVDNIYVVDDHSSDGTWETIRRYVAAGPSTKNVEYEATDQLLTTDGSGGEFTAEKLNADVTAVRHEENRGRGAAVITGHRLARKADHDVVAVMDGDGQMDPEILEDIIAPVVTGTAAYAKGNRLASSVHCWQMSGWRLFGNILLTLLTRIASGYWTVRDPQNGYTAISTEAVETLAFEELYEGYGFLNDVLIRLNAHSMQVVDVPMEAVYGDESSGIQYRSFVPKLSLLLFQGFFWRLWVKYIENNSIGVRSDYDVE